MDDRELQAYMQGVADTGARLVGVVAADLGPAHPVIERMVQRLGQLGEPEPDRERITYVHEADGRVCVYGPLWGFGYVDPELPAARLSCARIHA